MAAPKLLVAGLPAGAFARLVSLVGCRLLPPLGLIIRMSHRSFESAEIEDLARFVVADHDGFVVSGVLGPAADLSQSDLGGVQALSVTVEEAWGARMLTVGRNPAGLRILTCTALPAAGRPPAGAIEELLLPLLEPGALNGGELVRYSGPVEIEFARGDLEYLMMREVGGRFDLVDRFVCDFLAARPRHVRTMLTLLTSFEAYRSWVVSGLVGDTNDPVRRFGVDFNAARWLSNVCEDRVAELCSLIDEELLSGDGVLEVVVISRSDSAEPIPVGAFSLGWKELKTTAYWYALGNDRAATSSVRSLVAR